VWATDFGGNAVYRVNPDLTIDTINGAATTANGVFFDENRSILYWSQYNLGRVHMIPIDEMDGSPGASTMVADLTGQTDGLTMDICGHIYAVDQAGGGACRIDRVHLDEDGNLAPEGVVEIAGAADLPNGCSNAQFGYGFGDENDERLFTVGVDGDVYRIDVGVEGYLIPF
jgi:sugar lactone lactonase YvrE